MMICEEKIVNNITLPLNLCKHDMYVHYSHNLVMDKIYKKCMEMYPLPVFLFVTSLPSLSFFLVLLLTMLPLMLLLNYGK